VPWLWGRTVGGTLMLISHFVFAFQFFMMIKHAGPRRFAPALFRDPAPMETAKLDKKSAMAA